MDLQIENIENLTSLWRFASKKVGDYKYVKGYEIGSIAQSEWPNRLWFSSRLDIPLFTKIIQQNPSLLTITTWGDHLSYNQQILASLGFELKLEQHAMFLELAQIPEYKNKIIIQQVRDYDSSVKWSAAFEDSFGYTLSAETVMKTKDSVDYYLGFYEGETIGTIAVFNHNSTVAGIHSMGILPSMRRRGFAEALLIQVLNIAKHKGSKYATLQSSEMGKGLYRKAGFQEQFIIKSFIQSNKDKNELNR
jgi:ribosomal protein S18 acetylase RimI-like enzyme